MGPQGEPGINGINGIQGQPGKDGHTPVITIGSNGNWFVDGEDTGISARGEKGDKGEKGNKGDAGKDGVSVVNSYIDENGDLICELSNGQKINAGHVKDVTKHTVTLHVDDEIVSTIRVEDGAKISRPSGEATAGYMVSYWYLSEANGKKTTWVFDEDSYFAYTVDRDIDLYADYCGIGYIVTFVDEAHGKMTDPITVIYDSDYSFVKLDGVAGYTFIGWKTEGGVSYDFSGKWRTPSDVTLYAEWKNNEYTVTLDPSKGSVSESTVSVTYDKTYSLPTPERHNYTFLGWYDEEDKLVSGNATWKRTKDETFTAKWTNVQNTYVFDSGDGTCDVASMVIGWEDEYELPIAYPNDEYSFEGWYLGDSKIPQKGIWTYSNSGGTLKAKYKRTGDVKLGKYPQSNVTDSSTLASLSSFEKDLPTSSNSKDWTSYKYYISGSNATDFMWYKDVECSGNRYRGVYFTSYRPVYCTASTDDSHQDGNGYLTGQVYWFKWEPVIWKVLSDDNGKCSLLSDFILDAQQFYHQSSSNSKRDRSPYDSNETARVYDNNYKYSDIRGWLDTAFYDSCFDEHQKTLIKTSSVDNSISSTGYSSNSYACEDTNDKVFLLSYKEATDSANGFTNNTSRKAYATDYAKCQGVYVNSSTNTSHWWLRSPYVSGSCNVSFVDRDGYFSIGTGSVDFTYIGVRPAIKANLD